MSLDSQQQILVSIRKEIEEWSEHHEIEEDITSNDIKDLTVSIFLLLKDGKVISSYLPDTIDYDDINYSI